MSRTAARTPAAQIRVYLALLPSGPDAVRRLKLHRVRAAVRLTRRRTRRVLQHPSLPYGMERLEIMAGRRGGSRDAAQRRGRSSRTVLTSSSGPQDRGSQAVAPDEHAVSPSHSVAASTITCSAPTYLHQVV